MWLWTKRVVRAPGLFALYVAGYSGFRVFEETQRIDFSNHFLGMRVNFWIASCLCLAGLVSFVIIQRGLWGRGCEPARPAPPGSMVPGGRAAKTSGRAPVAAPRPAVATAPDSSARLGRARRAAREPPSGRRPHRRVSAAAERASASRRTTADTPAPWATRVRRITVRCAAAIAARRRAVGRRGRSRPGARRSDHGLGRPVIRRRRRCPTTILGLAFTYKPVTRLGRPGVSTGRSGARATDPQPHAARTAGVAGRRRDRPTTAGGRSRAIASRSGSRTT